MSKAAVKNWLKCKNHRKLAAEESQPQVQPTRVTIAILTEVVTIADQEVIQAAVKSLAMEGFREEDYTLESDEDTSFSDEEL